MSANIAVLESLLRARRLDGSLVSTRPLSADRLATTDVGPLDAQLGGGLARGHLSEIVGPRSSGRMSVLMAALAAATDRGEVVAFIDTFDNFDPASAQAAGVDVSRLLWVRGRQCPERMASDCIGRGIKATGLVAQAGRFGIVAIDLAEAPAAALRRLPFTTWRRLARAIEGSETVGIVVGTTTMGRSASGRSIVLGAPDRSPQWRGHRSRSCVFQGLDSDARVESTRFPAGFVHLRTRESAIHDLRPPTPDPRPTTYDLRPTT